MANSVKLSQFSIVSIVIVSLFVQNISSAHAGSATFDDEPLSKGERDAGHHIRALLDKLVRVTFKFHGTANWTDKKSNCSIHIPTYIVLRFDDEFMSDYEIAGRIHLSLPAIKDCKVTSKLDEIGTVAAMFFRDQRTASWRLKTVYDDYPSDVYHLDFDLIGGDNNPDNNPKPVGSEGARIVIAQSPGVTRQLEWGCRRA